MRASLDSDGLCFRRKGRAWRLKVMRDWGRVSGYRRSHRR